MIVLAGIIGLLILFLSIQCILWSSEGKTYGFGISCGCTLAALLVLEIMCISECISKLHPKAIDVYQGKTTLEYIIRDGVKIDSVVVWKGDIGNED